jgi:predicted nucleotidyltransferase
MTGRRIGIDVPHDRLAEFCRRHHIRRLAFFGSVLREDFTPLSDVDVLVEIEPGITVTFFSLARMEYGLSDLLGRHVDLHMPSTLNRSLRDKIVKDAETVYDAA